MNSIAPRFIVKQNDTVLNVYHADKGEGLPKHDHIYSHLITCHAGAIQVSNERRVLAMTKDTQPVNLAANEWHEIEAIENETVFLTMFAEHKL